MKTDLEQLEKKKKARDLFSSTPLLFFMYKTIIQRYAFGFIKK